MKQTQYIMNSTFRLAIVLAPVMAWGQVQDFSSTVKPMLTKSCAPCHNEQNASGSVNIKPFTEASSLGEYRDDWERIIKKVRSGEMPPKGFPRPAQAQIDQLLGYVKSEFEKADAKIPADPGRVTARRLNRNEYSNTIRDLLLVDFRADQDFPTDDSGHGFDNIGDVLTISPLLMEKYLNAAERISARALGLDPLPKKPIEFELHSKDKKIRRVAPSLIEATHRVDWDAEYQIEIGLPGERVNGKPVLLGFWMDGKLLHTQLIETKPSGLVYFNPYSAEQFRLFLPAGEHRFRAGFIDDEFVKTLAPEDLYKDKKNKFLNMIKLVGPYASKVEPASRKAILVCDPASGTVCVEKILGNLARRAWRRPVTAAEVKSLSRFVALAKAEGQTAEQGLQVAMTAMLVSPHFLFRIERDLYPKDPLKTHPITSLELATRLSYYLWSSMPDEELLKVAETGKLREPAVLEAQVKRMLGDSKSAALAANFAGQWLETRNLNSVKPDPKKFPEWNPELRDAMAEETRLFFETVLRDNLSIGTFLDAKFTFLNETLAKHYGIAGVTGPEFRRVELTGNQRGGILTQASVLTVSSYPTRTSPVIRGKYILQNVFGAPPPPPPPDVPLLDEEKVGSSGSLRQQLEKHRSSAMCASCHNRMDTLGFALENYDGTGKWRDLDGKFAIEPAGTLPNGKAFQNPSELRQVLAADMGEFAHNLVEKMMTYALGRGLERFDRRTVQGVQDKLAADQYRFQTLIFEVVRSLPFQTKRAEYSKQELAKK
jgi:mono/diheme cytochrome c family protein